MAMLSALLLSMFAVALCRAGTDTETLKMIDVGMAAYIEGCVKDMGVNVNGPITVTQKYDTLDKLDPCFFECIWKKMEIMHDQRIFNMTKLVEDVKKFLNRPGDAEKLEAIGKACAYDQPFTECEQSRKMLYCLIENRDKVYS